MAVSTEENDVQDAESSHSEASIYCGPRVHTVQLQGDTGKEKFINDNMGRGRFPKQCSIPTVPHEQIGHPTSTIPYSLHEPLRSELNRLVKRLKGVQL